MLNCLLCGDEIEKDEESLWGHIQMEHEEKFDEVQDLETPDMIEECYEKRNIMSKLVLTYIGMDGWDRPVYKEENGRLWKDVNPRPGREADLCTSMNNAFQGEPDTNMHYMRDYDTVTIEYVPERITWKR